MKKSPLKNSVNKKMQICLKEKNNGQTIGTCW